MNSKRVFFTLIIIVSTMNLKAQSLEKETVMTKYGGAVDFYFIKHSSVYFTYDDLVIYVDPVSYPNVDYGQLPKADYILITHEHYDHLDEKAIDLILKERTTIISNQAVNQILENKTCLDFQNYDSVETETAKIKIKAFPAYNTTPEHKHFHPQGRDNGYLVTVGGTCIYFAGDCEDMPEMEEIKYVDVAFLPINQPYTMTVKQAIHAAEMIQPKILFPYHYGDTDLKGLEVLKEKGIKVIIKQM